MIGLADCNNFFVSCERSVDRSLEGKAVVVLSNNDGCVVARSNEAKRMGIRMGQPAFELRHLFERNEVIPISGNHILYRDISLKVHDIFRRFVPAAIDYSVDEAFLDVSGIPTEVLTEIGKGIYQACWEEMRIPVTIGFAPTKTLAKISTELSKKAGEKVGLIRDECEAMEILEKFPITELWGIGRRLTKRLYQSGIFTAAQFARKDCCWVRQKFGVNGERIWLELHCQPCIELDHVDRLLQDSISESRTFPEDVMDYDYVRARIVIYSSDCARKLRAMGGVCRNIGVFLRTNPFHTSPTVIRPEGMLTLPEPTSDTSVIIKSALTILDNIYIENIAFKRAGIWLGNITPARMSPPSIFDTQRSGEQSQMNKFMQTIDKINSLVGSRKIGPASQIVKGHRGHNDGYSSSFQAPSRRK